jgi:hypothetical protein
MEVILELVGADSLEWVHKEVLVACDMFALFVITNTKEELVHDVVPKCKKQISN